VLLQKVWDLNTEDRSKALIYKKIKVTRRRIRYLNQAGSDAKFKAFFG